MRAFAIQFTSGNRHGPPAQASIWILETILTATLIFTVFCATDAERGQTAAHIPVRSRCCGRPCIHLLWTPLWHNRRCCC